MKHRKLSAMGRAYRFIWQPRFGWKRKLITEPLMRRFLQWRQTTPTNTYYLRFRHRGRSIDVDIESKDLQLAPWPKGFEFGFEIDLQILLMALAKDIGTFYDVGANFGFFALFLACLPDFEGKIYAFEPSPVTYGHLRKFVNAVDIEKRIESFAVALSDKEGIVSMGSPVETHSGYARIGAGNGDVFSVPTTRLDSWLDAGERRGPDFIKLDVEGHEAYVLRGGAGTIERYRPFVYYESGWDIGNAEQDEIFAFFKDRHYVIYLPTWIYEENDWWRTCCKPLARKVNHLALIDVSAHPETLHDRSLLQSLNLLACPAEKAGLLGARLRALRHR